MFDEILFKNENRQFNGLSPSLIKERGIAERRTALGAMMARDPLRDVIVSLMMMLLLLFPRRGPPPSPGGIGSAGPGEKNTGGRSPRGNGMGVSPIKR